MKLWKSVAAAAALSLVSLSALASDYKVGELTLTQPWTRATPPKAKAGGGFVEIVNNGTDADRLVAVSSDVAAKVEIHEMAVTDGVMKMRKMEKWHRHPGWRNSCASTGRLPHHVHGPEPILRRRHQHSGCPDL